MRINHKILSIPPYISTSWKNVASLKAEQKETSLELQIILQDGSLTAIPNMENSIVEAIFSSHAKFLENELQATKNVSFSNPNLLPFSDRAKAPTLPNITSVPLPDLKILSKLNSFCQHDREQSNAEKLPDTILEQFSDIAKSMNLRDVTNLPKPEPHCNCPFCQITHAIHVGLQTAPPPATIFYEEDEEVSDEDLNFTSWIIEPMQNEIYKVINPDEPDEQYLVSLKSPIGCTCGCQGCEHIQTVLRS